MANFYLRHSLAKCLPALRSRMEPYQLVHGNANHVLGNDDRPACVLLAIVGGMRRRVCGCDEPGDRVDLACRAAVSNEGRNRELAGERGKTYRGLHLCRRPSVTRLAVSVWGWQRANGPQDSGCGSEKLTGAMLGDEAIAAGAGSGGAGAGAGVGAGAGARSTMIEGMLFGAGVDGGGADTGSGGVAGDGGSGRFAACSSTASCRSDAGAVPAETNSGGDDAATAPAAAGGGSSSWSPDCPPEWSPDWLLLLLRLPARTNSSTSDGRALSCGRGRNPTCIPETCKEPASTRVTLTPRFQVCYTIKF